MAGWLDHSSLGGLSRHASLYHSCIWPHLLLVQTKERIKTHDDEELFSAWAAGLEHTSALDLCRPRVTSLRYIRKDRCIRRRILISPDFARPSASLFFPRYVSLQSKNEGYLNASHHLLARA